MLAFYFTLIDEPGDREIFTEIYKAYREKMLTRAMSILNNRALADEAVQESLLKIAGNIDRFRGKSRSRTAALIAIIVRNLSLNILKKEHMNEKVPLDGSAADSIPSDVLGRMISDGGYTELLDAVRELDDIYSDILILKLVYGYDTSAAAELLNVPKRTAETRFYRGKKILKERLREHYGKQQ